MNWAIRRLQYATKFPVRSITLHIFGGISLIGTEPPTAVAGFWIAIAGPSTRFALAAFFSLVQPLFLGVAPLLARIKYLAYINVALGLFNLIPGFPLDGGWHLTLHCLGCYPWHAQGHPHRRQCGTIYAYLFICFGVWQVLGGNFMNGLWIAFIGWFLENAARGAGPATGAPRSTGRP